MRGSRYLMTLCCAFAVAAVLAVPGVRADEYTKLTYLTFGGPVQVRVRGGTIAVRRDEAACIELGQAVVAAVPVPATAAA